MSTEEDLVQLLEKIQASADPPVELLLRFRDGYRGAPRDARFRFLSLLLTRMEVPQGVVAAPLRAVLGAPSTDAVAWTLVLTDLRRKLESPRMRAFRRFLNVSGGLKFLLDLRADVLAAERISGDDLGPVDEEIAHLFTSWFQYGFLFLQEITQDSSYRQIRFLKEHDLVHPMASLEEMGNRLGEDRRQFALYHRAMPEEPIVFIEAALTRRIPSSIHEILAGETKGPVADPDTAVFYSINNAQDGLVGLGLGKLLIFQVVDSIKQKHPQIGTFATLSPLPGFWSRYLKPILEGSDEPFLLKKKAVLEKFTDSAKRRLRARFPSGDGDFAAGLVSLLSTTSWLDDSTLASGLKRPLTEIAFDYLSQEKDPTGKPLNPVAGFHLGNGARLSRRNVLFGANRTARGLQDSCGLMVSYIYSSTWLHELRRTVRSMLPWQA